MALKKSELYSSLWQSCDALRGGMDASQYKDYVLVLLFIKYVSDKYAGKPYQPITIPAGAGFADMVAFKGKGDIGDQINKKIIAPLVAANDRMLSQSDFPDFNDATKLGTGKEMVDRLTDLVAIFEGKALDFSKNRADGDDILGDAYEYLMQHFATESGKSKGQFYTPAEVSRVIAQVLGIGASQTTHQTTVYVQALNNGTYEGFVAGAKAEQALGYFEQWYGTAALEWLERFHYRKTEDLELLATVDMAMVDLAAAGRPADMAGVKRVIAAHPDWVPKLSRELFSDDNIRRAIAECAALFAAQR